MASVSTLLTPIADLFSPQQAPVDLDVPLSPKRKLKFGVRIWRGVVFQRQTCKPYIYSERNVENEKQPASAYV